MGRAPSAGAGRKPARGRRSGVAHVARSPHIAAHPLHVTLRTTDAVRCLRATRVFPAVYHALTVSSHQDFRIIAFSVQDDHVHLIVEANDTCALSHGLRGLNDYSAGGTPRSGLCLDESPEALRGRTRSGSLLVGAVFHRL